jgi:hypothetical protein
MNGLLSFATYTAVRTAFRADYDAIYGAGSFDALSTVLPPGWFMAFLQSLLAMLTGGCIPPTPVPTPASLKAMLADPQYEFFEVDRISLMLYNIGGRHAQSHTLRLCSTCKVTGAKLDDAVIMDMYNTAQSA